MRRILALAFALAVLPAARMAGPQDVSSSLFDARALLRDLQTLSADDMEGRQIGTPGGAKARAFVIARFRDSGIEPFGGSYEQPFTYMAGRGTAQTERQGVNVIGRIAGATSPDRCIVISAHYDHLGARNGTVFNGADDNASGTAALFALAAYFRAHPPANTLIFAAFDGEETGLRGARAFVAAPPVAPASIVVDLNVDMIGRDPNDVLYVVGTTAQPGLRPFIERVAAKAPVKLVMGHDDPAKARENPRNQQFEDWTADSDHKAFCDAKIPCLYFGVEDFDQHHRATDDYETMTLAFYVRATETMVRAVEEFDAHAAEVLKLNGAGKPKAPRP
jgi:Zn-dependent M28 family amino/carboxypeptidase